MRPFRTSLALALVLLGSSGVSAQVVRISVSTAGIGANGESVTPDVSADGRIVAFRSFATNLVESDTNGLPDVFVRDRDTDADGVFDEAGAVSTTMVSGTPSGAADGSSTWLRVSADGRFVFFASDATNLLDGTRLPAGISRIYRHDRQNGATILVSDDVGAFPGRSCDKVEISDNGSVAVMHCNEPVLGSGIFVRDYGAGAIARVSDVLPPDSFVPPAFFTVYEVDSPTISADGRYVAFAETVSQFVGIRAVSQSGTITLVDRVTGIVRADFVVGTGVFLAPDGSAVVVGQSDIVAGVPHTEHRFLQSLATGTRLWASTLLNEPSDLTADGRTLVTPEGLHNLEFGRTFPLVVGAHALSSVRLSGDMRVLVGGSVEALVSGDTNNATDVFVVDLAPLLDADADTLDDRWETFFGLSTSSGTGDNGPAGDPDGDGVTNADEEAAGTHPRGAFRRYLAEGASGTFFSTRIALANADPTNAATAVLRFEKGDGTSVSQPAPVAARSRTTREPGAAVGLGIADFSTVVESDRPIVVDRLMQWDASGYGSHAETATVAPSSTWFLAEGTTVLGFQLFYLLQNPQATPATATVRYLLPSGSPVVRTYELPARSRTTIYVNTVPGLDATDVSAEITATQPIVVERAMYRNTDTQAFALGHAASGVTQASASWFLAEGATGTFFDTYVLIANPSAQPAPVQVDFLTDAGSVVSRTYTVGANSRFSVYADGVPGLEAASFGARITSTVPVVVERAMYWAGGYFDYYEGHVSAAVTETGSHWVLAHGEAGGPAAAQTYVLLANTGASPIEVSLRALVESGASPPVSPLQVTVPANGRVSMPLSTVLGGAGLAEASLSGVEVTEVTAQPTGALVVEGAIYRNVGSQLWGAGASLPATRVP